MSSVAKVQKKVLDILSSEFGSVNVSSDGSIRIAHESTMVTVDIEEWINGQTVVEIAGVIARDSKSNSAVYEWVNERNITLKFGSIVHIPAETKNITVLKHSLLGDFLDPAELTNALLAVVFVADELDDQFISKFGGERFIDFA